MKRSILIIVAALLAAAVAIAQDGAGLRGTQRAAEVTVQVTPNKVPVEGGFYSNISPIQLNEMLKSKDFFLVNTHVPYEGELDRTDAFVPFDQTPSRIKEFPADKTAKIVLYCRSGHMSDIAARVLVKAGFSDVSNLDGGMIAWDEAGFPIRFAGAGAEARRLD